MCVASEGRSAELLTGVKEPLSFSPGILYYVFLLEYLDFFFFCLNLHQVDADLTFLSFAHKPSSAECSEDKASQFVRVCVCAHTCACVLLCVNFGDSDLCLWVHSLRKRKKKKVCSSQITTKLRLPAQQGSFFKIYQADIQILFCFGPEQLAELPGWTQ